MAASTPVQLATRDDEPGCHAYCFAADPCVPTRIQVYELWEDEASLVAHFRAPELRRRCATVLGQLGITGAWNRCTSSSKNEPVYGAERHDPRSKFFVDGD